LKDLPFAVHPNLIVGMEHSEDAGVYKLREDLAIIQTVDFFTPIVDDPYDFGRIAVANALSDVYAMGGVPLTAMNIVCFPIQTLGAAVLRDILRGGLDKMREAEVLLVGGHSVEDKEPKYGLSVTGVVHPERVVMNRGARPGDVLILTKPIGTGVVSTAAKAGEAPPRILAEIVASMASLNRAAADIMVKTPGVHACTDVTGFGLIGHACEMIEGEEEGIFISFRDVPLFAGVLDLLEGGFAPGGLYRNKRFRIDRVDVSVDCPEAVLDILFDPQTSGGLLISVSQEHADGMLGEMHRLGLAAAARVGRVLGGAKGKVVIG